MINKHFYMRLAVDELPPTSTPARNNGSPKFPDVSHWPEVRFINGYAMLIGFLEMGIKGLSVLVFTWTTVVLLGGFVSDLGKKDFWCLTAITLIQTFSAGVFNFLWNEKSSDKRNSINIVLAAVSTMAKDTSVSKTKRKMFLLDFFLWVVQLLVLAFVLCPLVVVYIVGLYISTGISLWRLIEHDYGDSNKGSNKKPALLVLYSLALAQGVFLSYKTMYTWVKGAGLVEEVANKYTLDSRLVLGYLSETMEGCSKDPMFTRERNLVKYAVDLLMESKSNDSYLSGIKILGKILRCDYAANSGHGHMIKEQLTRSASFGHMIQGLMDTMGTESPYDSEIKEQAATIVKHVAHDIRLRYFPGGIHFLSSLLNTVENYKCLHSKNEHEKPELTGLSLGSGSCNDQNHGCNWLVVQSLRIIQNLAADEDNCRIIIKTPGLIPKITAPLVSYKLHRDHHVQWSKIVEESLELMSRLMAAPEETGEMFQSKISGSREAVFITLRRILECHNCALSLKMEAVKIVLYPSVDTSPSIMASGSSSKIFIWILLLLFLPTDDQFERTRSSTHRINVRNDDIRQLAGEKLSDIVPLPSEGSNTTIHVVGDLTGALVSAGSISNSIHAAKIMEHLCLHYTKDDVYLKNLKEAMVHVMPTVLKEILGDGQEDTASSHQTNGELRERRKRQEALISLCWTIYSQWYEKDPVMTRQLNEIAFQISSEQGMPDNDFPDIIEALVFLKQNKAEESSPTVQIVVA